MEKLKKSVAKRLVQTTVYTQGEDYQTSWTNPGSKAFSGDRVKLRTYETWGGPAWNKLWVGNEGVVLGRRKPGDAPGGPLTYYHIRLDDGRERMIPSVVFSVIHK